MTSYLAGGQAILKENACFLPFLGEKKFFKIKKNSIFNFFDNF